LGTISLRDIKPDYHIRIMPGCFGSLQFDASTRNSE
jgi:hypothetical protein